MSALLLHDLVSIQLSDTTSTVNITSPSVNPRDMFRPDTINVWVNGLWAVSLTASLVVALVAVLVKQWLHHYTALTFGTLRERAYVRQFKFDGLECWQVNLVIGMLPIVMNISLGLFFIGLVLFYIPLCVLLAWTIGVISIIVTILYFVSNIIPIVFLQCPYQTPLTHFFNYMYQLFYILNLHLKNLYIQFDTAIRVFLTGHLPFLSFKLKTNSVLIKPLYMLQIEDIQNNINLLIDTLNWLLNMTSNSNIHSLILQSIGGLPFEVESYAKISMKHMSATHYILLCE